MGKLSDATEDFVLLDGLKALAKRLASDIDGCTDSKDVASLSRQYRETMKTIHEVEGGVEIDNEVAAIILRNKKSASD